MIREINNVFTDFPDYGCFACDPRNKLGLQMKFFADDSLDEVFTRINLAKHFSGFPGIMHGGIQCALIDEVAFWTMFDRFRKIGLTARIEINYQKKVETLKDIEVRGRIKEYKNRRVTVDVEILDDAGMVNVTGIVTYLMPSRKMLYKLIGEERFTEKFQQYIQD